MKIPHQISTRSGACVRSSAQQWLDLDLDDPHGATGAPGSDLARSGVKGGSPDRVRTRAGLPDQPSDFDPDELLAWGEGYSAATSLPSENGSTLSDCRVRTASTAVSPVCCLTRRDRPLSMSQTISTSSPSSRSRSESISTEAMETAPMEMPLHRTNGRPYPRETRSEHSRMQGAGKQRNTSTQAGSSRASLNRTARRKRRRGSTADEHPAPRNRLPSALGSVAA